MLYLAEVQKQKGGLLGSGAKTELKLLACQKNDQSWNTVPEEVIAADEASKLNDGALVLAELNATRQVQRLQEAGRPLVTILQNFSRQLEKFKLKEEEIDQWKESLTFQGQEISRREMELEAREEEARQIQEEAQHIDAKIQEVESSREEVESSRQEIESLQEEINRSREELEGAWEQLRGEQRRLEEFQSEVQPGAVLDEEQARVISDLLEKLSNNIAEPASVREHLDNAFEMVENQQAILNPHWEQLEQQKAEANEQQAQLESLSGELQEANSSFEEIENSLHEQAAELKINTATLESKQDSVQVLQEQLEQYQKLQEQLDSCNQTSNSSSDEDLTLDFDAEALKSMSTEELLKTIEDLQEKLKVDSSFVEEQEQELNYKQQTIDELQERINSASEEERGAIEEELTDEKDSYQMLNETLVGQRRSLVERQESLEIHQTVLSKRKKQASGQSQVNLTPVVEQIEQGRQKYSEQLEKLEAQIEQMRDGIQQAQETITAKTEERDTKRQTLQAMEENLSALQTANAQLWARVNLYEETLQPIQDSLESLRHKLQAIGDALTQVQETGDYQLQAITDMRSSIENLIAQ